MVAFTDGMFKCILVYEYYCVLIQIPKKFPPKNQLAISCDTRYDFFPSDNKPLPVLYGVLVCSSFTEVVSVF